MRAVYCSYVFTGVQKNAQALYWYCNFLNFEKRIRPKAILKSKTSSDLFLNFNEMLLNSCMTIKSKITTKYMIIQAKNSLEMLK